MISAVRTSAEGSVEERTAELLAVLRHSGTVVAEPRPDLVGRARVGDEPRAEAEDAKCVALPLDEHHGGKGRAHTCPQLSSSRADRSAHRSRSVHGIMVGVPALILGRTRRLVTGACR